MQGKVLGTMQINGKQLLLVEGDQQASRAYYGAGAAIGAGAGTIIPGVGTAAGAAIGAGIEAVISLF